MITDYMKQLVYNEGYQAHYDNVLCIYNPYEGVNEMLKCLWNDGWWDAWYED